MKSPSFWADYEPDVIAGLTQYFGGRAVIDLQNVEALSGGVNSDFCLKLKIVVNEVEHLLAVKKPTRRKAHNARELFFYKHILPFEPPPGCAPAFYCSIGRLESVVFLTEFVLGRPPSLDDLSADGPVISSIINVNSQAPPFDKEKLIRRGSHLLPLHRPRRFRSLCEKVAACANAEHLEAFFSTIDVYIALYSKAPRVLCHGDLNVGNIRVNQGRAIFIDWSNWGIHPAGSDVGRKLLGLLRRRRQFGLIEQIFSSIGSALDIDPRIIGFSAHFARLSYLVQRMAKGTLKFDSVRGEVDFHVEKLSASANQVCRILESI